MDHNPLNETFCGVVRFYQVVHYCSFALNLCTLSVTTLTKKHFYRLTPFNTIIEEKQNIIIVLYLEVLSNEALLYGLAVSARFNCEMLRSSSSGLI